MCTKMLMFPVPHINGLLKGVMLSLTQTRYTYTKEKHFIHLRLMYKVYLKKMCGWLIENYLIIYCKRFFFKNKHFKSQADAFLNSLQYYCIWWRAFIKLLRRIHKKKQNLRAYMYDAGHCLSHLYMLRHRK